MENQNQQQGQQRQMQIKIPDEILKGVYANAMQVAHSREEFILDFLNLSPHMGAGIVSSRVIMSPGHLKRVIAALTENLKKYEEKFGKIEEAEAPEEIGFKG
ncbi:DUF3467 domain-containing protein [Candidatus Kuenenbacteria bacterium CG_4_9_14_3_um_filter_39_14]|uniref:DUF3467 domain-containing protein n=7 Tax=Candidatus Kueneniibacteriota TaxID=1752740 RepID=A0A2M7IM24_9BACT|nr:DUF3467 domain-containing protein [Candidatus Kuenenbacteria bacterium]OIP55407.1 MAG: hypothetical protein AUK13_02835 [Candidatus Kuenenbacteria bacterium CG2_30_39_24]PIP28797.1 MAG: hypothetical protein COX28_02785 [Candidatus Kuenenbacteria bacterium CG23_combo_of_CG06-09_8_20_14_all_39_39]PIP75810.1 MAG: hypothetical protein COW86_01675 [Candidatus Kuenenbacteria bacterium CG22_combo_CG10-13_8_21_14_all_39_9]PIR80617.1 MAG: DUF3467 domain-containing protein [Candidatus Kuenenbacteria b